MFYSIRSLRILGEFISLFLLSLTICIFSVPAIFSFFFALIIVVCLHFYKEDRFASVIVAMSLAITLLISEVILRTLPKDLAPQYYRPDEMLIHTGMKKHEPRYKENQSILNWNMKYGDLYNISPLKKLDEPRVVNFITDDLGHRNKLPYGGQNYIIFGDSFVVGSGTSQENIISEYLSRDHLLPTYNAGFPGEPQAYVNKVKELRNLLGTSFQGVMLFFEGNDFRCEDDHVDRKTASQLKSILTYIPEAAQKLETYRLFFGLTRRALALASPKYDSDHVLIYNISQPVAFHKGYKKVTERKDPCWHWSRIVDPLKEVSSSIRLIVFIPDKYRVYHKFIRSSDVILPKTQSNFVKDIASELGIEYLDLTDPLIIGSEELLKNEKFTWWRDDTHWSPEGISIAAAEIAKRLNKNSR